MGLCSYFVLIMQIETLGDVWSLGGKVYARCLWNGREGLKSVRRCDLYEQIDLRALIWTRGRDCPISMLSGGRMRCPNCGSREVSVIVNVPTHSGRKAAS